MCKGFSDASDQSVSYLPRWVVSHDSLWASLSSRPPAPFIQLWTSLSFIISLRFFPPINPCLNPWHELIFIIYDKLYISISSTWLYCLWNDNIIIIKYTEPWISCLSLWAGMLLGPASKVLTLSVPGISPRSYQLYLPPSRLLSCHNIVFYMK